MSERSTTITYDLLRNCLSGYSVFRGINKNVNNRLRRYVQIASQVSTKELVMRALDQVMRFIPNSHSMPAIDALLAKTFTSWDVMPFTGDTFKFVTLHKKSRQNSPVVKVCTIKKPRGTIIRETLGQKYNSPQRPTP